MREFTFESDLWLPRPRHEVFSFFADARNLEIITPPWVRFKIITAASLKMKVGLLIDYKVHVRRIPFHWQSEITVWEPPDRFVDEQRRGPYRQWIHEHLFVESAGGTICKDIVRYSVPGGWLVERFLVRRDLKRIFAFRSSKLAQLFPKSFTPKSAHLIRKNATDETITDSGNISLCE